MILRLWMEPEVNFRGRYYAAGGAVLEPKPLQKPHPLLLFGGGVRLMYEMAGRYGDICLIPPWIEVASDEARRIVLEEAERIGRKGVISFALMEIRPKYDPKWHLKMVQEARDNGIEYLILGFWHNSLEAMKFFAQDVIPSFGS